MVTLAIFILRQMLSVGQLKISLPGQPDIVVLPRKRSQKSTAELVPEDRLKIAISLPDPAALFALVLRPDPLFGEYYMRGILVIKEGSFEDFVAFLFENISSWRHSPSGKIYCHIANFIGWFASTNPLKRARRNVAHHYDLTDQLFDLFLDQNRQYSCAYYRSSDDSLAQAQRQKMARLAAKLCLKPGMRVLDIGCGWGRLATAISKCSDNLHVMGITLSEN